MAWAARSSSGSISTPGRSLRSKSNRWCDRLGRDQRADGGGEIVGAVAADEDRVARVERQSNAAVAAKGVAVAASTGLAESHAVPAELFEGVVRARFGREDVNGGNVRPGKRAEA